MSEEAEKQRDEEDKESPKQEPPPPKEEAKVDDEGMQKQEEIHQEKEEEKEAKAKNPERDNFEEIFKKEARKKKESDRGTPRPERIDSRDLSRLQELFVPSADFLSQVEPGGNSTGRRIWIVHGPEHAGKLTTAMNLALRLLRCEPEKAKVYGYRRMWADSLTLIDLVGKDKESEKGRGAHILEDALDHRGGRLHELTSPRLDALDRTLHENDSFLILTTQWELKDLEPLSVCKVFAFPEDLKQVFEKHLDRFARCVEVTVRNQVVEAARSQWPLLSRYLKNPVQIERFCYKLGDLRSEIDDKSFEKLAQEAAYIGQETVRQAFEDLEENYKLYALLATLFDGIERTFLDEIYRLAVRHLRKEGVSTLRDEREIGMVDALEQIRARESETRQVVIEHTAFRDEVLRQIRNRRLLLYSLSDRLLDLCKEHSDPEHWEVRRAIGNALGRLAIQEKRGLEPISLALDELASHSHGGVASVAGFILAQICREEPQLRGQAVDRLNTWVRSGHPDRMWAAGAAAWRVYEALGTATQAGTKSSTSQWHRRVLNVIASLIRRAARFSPEAREGALPEQVLGWIDLNLQSAFFALVRVTSTSLPPVASKIREWLQSKREDSVREVVQFACCEVLEQAVFRHRSLLPEEASWLELIEPLLTLDPDVARVGDALMAALAHWTHWSLEDKDADEIYLHLLKASNRLSGRAAISFRAGLVRHWLTSESERVRLRGQALFRRSHAMEGLPLRSLTPVSGVVALDASREARSTAGVDRIFREILEAVGCYSKVTAAHLGGTRIPTSPKGGLKNRDLWSPFPRPRLLMPPLTKDSGEQTEPHVVVALTWGPILDLVDGEESPWWPPIQVMVGDWSRPDDPRDQEQDVKSAAPQPVPLTQDLDDIVTRIVSLLNSKPSRSLPEAGHAANFEGDLTDLDRPEGSMISQDRAARILASLLERSAADFSGCLEVLGGWLDDAGELPTRVASAGLRALLRFHAESERHLGEVEKEALLRLAFRLPPTDEGAAETVLETVLFWMDEAPWAERITSGDDLCMSWMRWFEGLIPCQTRSLDRWLSGMERREAAKKEGNAAVQKALHWLRFRLSLRAGGALPALENGKKYGVFLLDAFSPDRERGARLAKLVADLGSHSQLRDLPCLVFRLGRKAPLAVPGEKLDRNAVLPAAGARLPRLLGPILEGLPPEQILFALVLSAGPTLDAADWSEGPWSSRIRLYGLTDASPAFQPFIRISPAGKEEELNVILRNLKPLMEQGA